VRVEDLDTARVRPGAAEWQFADLAALGLDWDGPVEEQSRRTGLYAAAVERLEESGLLYPCFCSRAEIRAAASAPHGPVGSYPGTCADLSEEERARRASERGRPPALRARTATREVRWTDRLAGERAGPSDDVVVRRGDGAWAYNLAVVVDDAAQGIGEVVRGDDLADSTPRQVALGRLLGLPEPRWAHVPLVLGPDGERLAKRHGAITLADRAALGESPAEVLALLARSLGLARGSERPAPARLLERFDPDALPREPWVLVDQPPCG